MQHLWLLLGWLLTQACGAAPLPAAQKLDGWKCLKENSVPEEDFEEDTESEWESDE